MARPRSIRALPPVAVLAALAACGTTSAPVRTVDQPVSYDVPAARQGVHLVRDEGVSTGSIDAPLDEVWRHLPAAYAGLGLEADALDVLDPAARRIVVTDHRVRRLGGERLSRYLDCGLSTGTPKADNGQARIDLESWLEPDGDATRIRIRFEGRSRDTGSSSGAVLCTSKGTLERELTVRLTLLVAGG